MTKCFAAIQSGGWNPNGLNQVDVPVNYTYSDRSANTTTGQATATINYDSGADAFNAAVYAAVIAQVFAQIAVTLDYSEITLVNPVEF